MYCWIIACNVQLTPKHIIFLLSRFSSKEEKREERILGKVEKRPKKCRVMKFREQRFKGGSDRKYPTGTKATKLRTVSCSHVAEV